MMKSVMQSLIATVLLVVGNNVHAESLRGNNNHRRVFATQENACELEIELSECMVIVDQNGGFPKYQNMPCPAFQFNGIDVEHCTQTPYSVQFIYSGEPCSKSDNVGALDFTCMDYTTFSSDEQLPTKSYIVVTNPSDDEQIYFKDYVSLWSDYSAVSTTGENLLDSGFRIRTYTDETLSSLIQEVVYNDALCSSHIEMGNRFGSSQIISYENEEQGYVSMFASIGFNVELTFSTKIKGGGNGVFAGRNGVRRTTPITTTAATMRSFKAVTDFAGSLDLSDDINGISVSEVEPVSLTLEHLPTSGGDHTLLVTATSQPVDSDVICTKTELFRFNVDLDMNKGLSLF